MGPTFHTDEQTEAARELDRAAVSMCAARLDVYEYKYVILHLHAALQGFMVLALRGSAGLDALTTKSARAWIRAYEEKHAGGDPTWPREFLEVPQMLFDRIQGSAMDRYTHSERFCPTPSQIESVKLLNRLRNKFVHFIPMSWAIDLSGLPDLVEDVLAIVAFLGWKSNNVHWHDDEVEQLARRALLRGQASTTELRRKWSEPTAEDPPAE